MSKRGKIILTILILMIGALITWVIKTTPSEPPKFEKIEPPSVMEYHDNTISEEKDGVKLWELTAEKVLIEIATQNAELTNLTGHFYQADGKTIEIKAQHGSYNNTTKDVHIEGLVIVTTSDGAKLTSDQLDWINAEEKMIATSKVKIYKDDMFAEGDQVESTNGFKHFKLKGNEHIIKGIQNAQ